MLRTIKAKFPTTCASCGADIARGDRVRWNGNGKVYCIDHKAHAPTSSSYPVQVILIGADGAVNVHRTDWEIFSKIAAILESDTLVSTVPAFPVRDNESRMMMDYKVESLPVESVEVVDVTENKDMPTIWDTDNPESGKEYLITPPTKPEPVSDPMAAMFAKLQAIDA